MIYDLVIIGGGPAGLGAAVYAARFRLKAVVLAKEPGGAMRKVHLVENWPGWRSISGAELADCLESHVRGLGVEIVQTEVQSISRKGKNFLISTDGGAFEARSVLLATGTKHRELGVPGEKEFCGRGVSYCAVCDATFFRDKTVAVIGGSDSAANEALLLSEYARKVYLIYRKDKIRAEPINYERVVGNGRIEVITNTNVRQIKGDKFVTSAILDKPYRGSVELPLDGVFIEIGYYPHSELAKNIGVKIDENGEIEIGRDSETNIPGVFAAGDVTSCNFKQAIIAAAQGIIASNSAYKYVNKR